MSMVSKHQFDEFFGNVKCSQIIHPWSESCGKGYGLMLWSGLKGSFTFYTVLNLIQVLIKYRKIKFSKNYAIELFKDIAYQAVLTGSIAGHFVLSSCMIRKIRGKFDYFGTVFMPGFLAGASIFIERSNKRSLFLHTYINQGLEAFVRQLDQKTGLRRTKFFDTVCFMFVNAYLLYLMREEYNKVKHNEQNRYYWFLHPPKLRNTINNDDKSSYCPHKGSCQKYCFKEPLLYFALGCGVQIFKEFANNFQKLWLRKGLVEWKNIFTKKSTYTFGIFVGGYVSIYRLINCWLCQRNKQDKLEFSFLAGFAGGLVYYVHPILTLYMAALAIIIQIHIARLKAKGVLPSYIPVNELIVMLMNGYLFHIRSFHADICPKFVLNGLKTCTSSRVDEMYQQFQKIVSESSLKKI